MEHLQTIPSTMADREKPFSMEKVQSFERFGSQQSLSNASNMGSQQLTGSQVNINIQINGPALVAGNRSSSGHLVSKNKFEPQPKRTLG